jgi:hypothetical protein
MSPVTGVADAVRSTVTEASDVKPGWGALLVVLVLLVATTLLWLSMRKQLGRISFEEKDTPRRGAGKPPPA